MLRVREVFIMTEIVIKVKPHEALRMSKYLEDEHPILKNRIRVNL